MSEDLRWQEVFFGGGRRRWPNEKAEGAHAADGRRGSEIWADPAVRRSDLAGRSTSADLPCGRKLGSAPEERHVYSSPSFSIFPPAPQGRYEASAAPVCRPCGARWLRPAFADPGFAPWATHGRPSGAANSGQTIGCVVVEKANVLQ